MIKPFEAFLLANYINLTSKWKCYGKHIFPKNNKIRIKIIHNGFVGVIKNNYKRA